MSGTSGDRTVLDHKSKARRTATSRSSTRLWSSTESSSIKISNSMTTRSTRSRLSEQSDCLLEISSLITLIRTQSSSRTVCSRIAQMCRILRSETMWQSIRSYWVISSRIVPVLLRTTLRLLRLRSVSQLKSLWIVVRIFYLNTSAIVTISIRLWSTTLRCRSTFLTVVLRVMELKDVIVTLDSSCASWVSIRLVRCCSLSRTWAIRSSTSWACIFTRSYKRPTLKANESIPLVFLSKLKVNRLNRVHRTRIESDLMDFQSMMLWARCLVTIVCCLRFSRRRSTTTRHTRFVITWSNLRSTATTSRFFTSKSRTRLTTCSERSLNWVNDSM